MTREVIFILDGAPNAGERCPIPECGQAATGVYDVCDAETLERLLSVSLCSDHGEKLATPRLGLLR